MTRRKGGPSASGNNVGSMSVEGSGVKASPGNNSRSRCTVSVGMGFTAEQADHGPAARNADDADLGDIGGRLTDHLIDHLCGLDGAADFLQRENQPGQILDRQVSAACTSIKPLHLGQNVANRVQFTGRTRWTSAVSTWFSGWRVKGMPSFYLQYL